MAEGAGWLLPSSPVLGQAPVQTTPSHPAGEAEPQAAIPSPKGSTAAAGFSGTASTPISPPSVISSYGIIAPASPTPTPTSLWRNGRYPVASNGSTTTDEGQTSCNLDYSEDAGPSVVINVEGGNRTGEPAGDEQIELHPSPYEVIPKVRAQLRRVAGDLFTPHTVPIGPYHQDVDSWLWTEEKKRAVHDLGRRGVDLSDLRLVLVGVQCRARGYYTHLPDEHAMDSEKFCNMLLHDGCYLLSFFVQYEGESPTVEPSGSNRQLTTSLSSDNTVVRDILYLLENQIPLFVIDEILKYLTAPGEGNSALTCIARPVEHLLQSQLYISESPREAPSSSSHLLDVVYFYVASKQQQQQQTPTQAAPARTGRWRRATEYRRYADVLFKRRDFDAGEEWTILAVDLDGGSLSIPLLRVDSNTWTILRNLMALEEYKDARPVTAYCYFMSQVACTAEDVELLRSAKVIEHFLGSDESAAQGFAGLCHGVALDIDNLQRNYLKPIWHDMEKRCGIPAHNFKGFFREKYCSNIFYRFVFFVALIVFACQVLQSIYAAVAYHKPNNSAAEFCCP
ncbi:hypothetical protein ACQ4PT_057599 [Festuca glaucescens]